MPFTVTWLPSASDSLARIWLKSSNRWAVTDSSHRIDRVLRLNPQGVGWPFGKFRIYCDAPLAVAYEIDPGDCMVRVIAVKVI
jgi:hypothetical protein